jgi:acyl-CoA synthetase (AMP-forming)/AMP-acid ligase II
VSEFWELRSRLDAPALVIEGAHGRPPQPLSYGELADRADAFAAKLPDRGSLGFVMAGNDPSSVIAYLGALRGRRCLALLPATLAGQQLQHLLDGYQPDWILMPEGATAPPGFGAETWNRRVLGRRRAVPSTSVHQDTALLLSTSGSTGSPKMVRLTRAAVAANAASIAEYLSLDENERAITTLPISYSYGLSVLNSHLHVQARTLLTDAAVVTRPFWDLFRAEGATSLAGVPYTWQMLARMQLGRMGLDSLRTLTQAGGALGESIKAEIAAMASQSGWRFFVMYGQTEACARIAYLPPEQLPRRPGSIGIAIPGGALSIDAATQELIYRGPNVMQGYSACRAELAQGDELHGTLRTGDLARSDDDGYFYLIGRLKRIAKVFGHRINLDEVEALLEQRFAGARFAAIDGGCLLVACSGVDNVDAVTSALRDGLCLHPSGFRVVASDIPQTSSGKKDYPALQRALCA